MIGVGAVAAPSFERRGKREVDDDARRYIAIQNSIRRYEKDGSEYSLNHIKKLEKRLNIVKEEIKYWNDKFEIVKKK